MGEGVGIMDGDENFLFANQAAEKIFGVGPGELVGTSLQRFLSPENLQLVRKQTSERQKGIHSTYEHEIISSNGDKKYVIVTATPNFGKNDEFLGAFVIFRDITQSRHTETMLRESESSLHSAQEIAKMGNWEQDIVKQETIWSKNYFKILGFKPDEVAPSFELFRSRIHPDDVRFFDQIHSAIMKDGKPFSFKLRLIQTDGKILWIKTNISPVIVDDQIVKIKGVIIDIDEQKQAEEALYQSIVRYEELFENINSGVAVYEARDDGRDFIFKDFNRAAEKIDNDKRERLIGKNICEVRPGTEKLGLLDVLRRVWSTGKPESLPVKEYKDDRRSGWYENFVYKLPSGEIVVVFDDVSKQKLAEEELKQTHEMLKRLFRHQDEIKESERKTISREIHDDLGQLLSAIKIDLGWTRANLANREEVLKKIDGMNDLVSETIKSVQTIASDLRPGLLDDLGLVPAIEWYCQEFEKRTGIRCHLKLDDYESLDENRNLALYRILQEALTNVLRHANAKNINICLVIEQGTIFFEIIDDGTGMKPEIINSKKSLGLIGIRERLNQINGSLEITSTMNKGTRLRIMVPIN
jgi:PAS domain S-box-containing protein